MDKESLKKLMALIDDQDIIDTMGRVSDNLDRVDRMKDQRIRPDSLKARAKDIHALLDADLEERVRTASSGLALVLTGGGGKGSYQAGACRALLEILGKDDYSSRITGVAGTSAGALNAALFAGGGPDIMEKLWTIMEESRMNGPDGFFSPSEENDEYLEELIRTSGVVEKITPEGLLTVVTAFDYESGYPKDFILNQLSEQEKVTCLLASSAFPIALKERELGGARYIDGGVPVFGSNMPVAPLYHLGFRRFVVIHCSSRAEVSEWSEIGKLNIMINREQYYNGAVFIHLYPGEDLGGIFSGTANFNHEYIMKNIELGYRDMIARQDDLKLLSEQPGPYDEVHVAGGERYRSYGELLDNL